MVTQLQLETNNNSASLLYMPEAACDQEELPKVRRGFAFFTFLPYTRSVMRFYKNTSTDFSTTAHKC